MTQPDPVRHAASLHYFHAVAFVENFTLRDLAAAPDSPIERVLGGDEANAAGATPARRQFPSGSTLLSPTTEPTR